MKYETIFSGEKNKKSIVNCLLLLFKSNRIMVKHVSISICLILSFSKMKKI